MWIFTNNGMISAVEHRDNKDNLMVRARQSKHLDSLIELTGSNLVVTDLADYRYRVTVNRNDFKLWLWSNVKDIDYDNFKNSIGDKKYRIACGNVWQIMYDYQLNEVNYNLDLRY